MCVCVRGVIAATKQIDRGMLEQTNPLIFLLATLTNKHTH